MAGPNRRIAVIYVPEHLTPFREHISSTQLLAIKNCLRRRHFDPVSLEYDPVNVLGDLSRARPSIVLNLAYGYIDRARKIHQSQADVVGVLETTGLPIIGSPARVQHLVQDKIECAEMLRRFGIVSPRSLTPDEVRGMPRLAIRKPRYGACHRDVRLVDHTADLRTFSPEQEILQEYILGPEFTVAVLEIDGSPVALPSLSVQFKKPLHIMVTGESDWDMVPARQHKTALSKVACRIFTELNMHDYARIDMRIRDRRIYVLDVNSLPNLDPERSYFPLAAKCAGLSFDRLLACLVRSALLRSALQKKRAKDADSHVERQ